jgi:hypothetical protein
MHFINADNLFEDKSYESAFIEIDLAISLRTTSDYQELKKDIEINLGNENIVEQQFKKHEFDIDSPIHTGEIYEWLKALLKKHKIEKVILYIEKTLETMDKLSNGSIQPKIYGKQRAEFYIAGKEDFTKNLHKIFNFSSWNIEQSDEAIKMLGIFIYTYTGKEIKPIESVADIYVSWNLKERALVLYKLCLNRLENEEKPRVKTRLTKKINELNAE